MNEKSIIIKLDILIEFFKDFNSLWEGIYDD